MQVSVLVVIGFVVAEIPHLRQTVMVAVANIRGAGGLARDRRVVSLSLAGQWMGEASE